jgi:hypothetical protein
MENSLFIEVANKFYLASFTKIGKKIDTEEALFIKRFTYFSYPLDIV